MKALVVASMLFTLAACGRKDLVSSSSPAFSQSESTCLNQTQLDYVYRSLGISPGSGLPVAQVCGSCDKTNPLAGFPARKDPSEDGRRRLFAFGDSTVQGIYRCYEGAHYEFPAVLANGLGMSNRNHGVGASKIADYYGQSGEILHSMFDASDTVLILTLHNDLSQYQGDRAHLEASKALLVKAITHIQRFTTKIYIGTPLSLPVYDRTVHAMYAQAVRDIAVQTGITLVDTATEFVPSSDNIGTDGVHPNAKGDEQIAQIFLKGIK